MESVDLNVIVSETLDDFMGEVKDTHARIVVGDLRLGRPAAVDHEVLRRHERAFI